MKNNLPIKVGHLKGASFFIIIAIESTAGNVGGPFEINLDEIIISDGPVF